MAGATPPVPAGLDHVFKRPFVGLGVIIENRQGKILIGKRANSHGDGMWAIIGGHLEFGESLEAAILREVAEETGLTDLELTKLVSVGNDVKFDRHYVSLGFHAKLRSGEAKILEPHKVTEMVWADPRELPEPFFPHSLTVVRNWLDGTVYVPEQMDS